MIAPILGESFVRSASLDNGRNGLASIGSTSINTSADLGNSISSIAEAMRKTPEHMQKNLDAIGQNLLGTQAKDANGNVIPNAYQADGLLGRHYALESQTKQRQADNEVRAENEKKLNAKIGQYEDNLNNDKGFKKEIEGYKAKLGVINENNKQLDNNLKVLSEQKRTLQATQNAIDNSITDIADMRSQQQFGNGETHRQVKDTLNSVMTQLGGGYNLQEGLAEWYKKGMDSIPAKMLKQNGMTDDEVKQFMARATTSWNIETERLNNINGNFSREDSILSAQKAHQYMLGSGFSDQQSAFYLNNANKQGKIQLEATKADIDKAMTETRMQKVAGLGDAEYIMQKIGEAELKEKERHNRSIEAALRQQTKAQQPSYDGDGVIETERIEGETPKGDRYTEENIRNHINDIKKSIEMGDMTEKDAVEYLRKLYNNQDIITDKEAQVFYANIKGKGLDKALDELFFRENSAYNYDRRRSAPTIKEQQKNRVVGIADKLGAYYQKEDFLDKANNIKNDRLSGSISYDIAKERLNKLAESMGIPTFKIGMFKNIGESDEKSLQNLIDHYAQEAEFRGSTTPLSFDNAKSGVKYITENVSKNIDNVQFSPALRKNVKDQLLKGKGIRLTEKSLDILSDRNNQSSSTDRRIILSNLNGEEALKFWQNKTKLDLTQQEAEKLQAQAVSALKPVTLDSFNKEYGDQEAVKKAVGSINNHNQRKIGEMLMYWFQENGITMSGKITVQLPGDEEAKKYTQADMIAFMINCFNGKDIKQYRKYMPQEIRKAFEDFAQYQTGMNIDNLIDSGMLIKILEGDKSFPVYNLYTLEKWIRNSKPYKK